MRQHGWSGDLPDDDEEAIRRIFVATRTCIDRQGVDTGISEVARELGVTRPTIYRYFRTTEDLLRATALDATSAFLDRIELHLRRHQLRNPRAAVVESIAFTLEQLVNEPYLGLLLTPGKLSIYSAGFMSQAAIALGRSMIDRFPIDWAAHGFTSEDLDLLVEQMLRMTQSLIVDPGEPPRSGDDLRAYLDLWLGIAVEALDKDPHRA